MEAALEGPERMAVGGKPEGAAYHSQGTPAG